MHDPTTANMQGPDIGSQYRSGIFFHDAEQEKIAKDVTDKVNKEWWKGKVVTEVLPAGEWWDAETYHQLYLDKSKLSLLYTRQSANETCRSWWLRMSITLPAQIPSSVRVGRCVQDSFSESKRMIR